jgi:RNA polymerase sigma-70 factor (ECF subfamily)
MYSVQALLEEHMQTTLSTGLASAATQAPERQALVELDDAQIAQRHLSGDARAFGTLVDRYQGRLLNFVNRTIGDRERAEDLVQEVFIRVFRHLHRFDQTKKFSTWIYTIASNLAKNELRNRSRNPLVFFQTIKRNWEADHRPLQFEDTTARPDDLYSKRGRTPWSSVWRSSPSTIGSCSCCGSSRARAMRKSPRSLVAIWAP